VIAQSNKGLEVEMNPLVNWKKDKNKDYVTNGL
jgi:hypothetical protein